MSNRVVAVVPAAGLGTRMGGTTPKQYLTLGGLPLLVHSLRVLDSVESIADIIIVVPEADRHFCETEMVRPFDFKKVSKVVAGGRRRQDSVRNGLAAVSGSPDFVVVHDGVRPFITKELVTRAVESGVQTGASVVAMAMPDTVKQVDAEGVVQQTLKREELWLIQTPQVFRYSWLTEAHQVAEERNLDVTDDAALIEELGYPVTVVQGSSMNIKITKPDDLELGEAIITSRKTPGG